MAEAAAAVAPILGDALTKGAQAYTFYSFLQNVSPAAWLGGLAAGGYGWYSGRSAMESLIIAGVGFALVEYASVAVRIGSWYPADVMAAIFASTATTALENTVDNAIAIVKDVPKVAVKVDNEIRKEAFSVGKSIGLNDEGAQQLSQQLSFQSFYNDDAGFKDAAMHLSPAGFIKDAIKGRNVGKAVGNDFKHIAKVFDSSVRTDEDDRKLNDDNWEEVVRRGAMLGLNRPFLMALKEKSPNVSGSQFWSLWDSIKQAIKPVSVNLWEGTAKYYMPAILREQVGRVHLMQILQRM